MLVETLLPIIPSEVILPLAGFEAAQGRMHPVSVIVAGTLGSLLGSLPWYWLGKRLGAERVQGWVQRHGRWMGVTPREVQRASEWLQRHGAFALTVGRCIPGVRGVISLPAGVVGVSPSTFTWACTAGSALWARSWSAPDTC